MAAQRASSSIAADGPTEENLAISTSRSTGIASSGGPSATTQPPIRRPWSGTRTSEPTAMRSRREAGTR
ncbi:MAG TPA: hypothetical protein DCQ52_17485 [Acidimicrobiaceae bacterium]|nr:hypothetical protein [Acidimicrobiaceae bacterium]